MQPIFGKTELKNGLTIKWLLFVDATLPLNEAQEVAMEMQRSWWSGVIVRCWIVPE